MSIPGVVINVTNGNLGLLPANPEQGLIYFGPSLAGASNTLAFYGDVSTMQLALDGGEVFEAAALGLSTSGKAVGVMNVPPTVAGALSSVTHVGTGTGTMTVSSAPHKNVIITITGTGSNTTATFTYQVGTGPVSANITMAATYLVPGTYTTLTFPSHTYTALETYTINTIGVVTYAANGSGGTDGSVTQASWPVDAFRPVITVSLGGALATATFTYSLDGTAGATTGTVLTVASGKYALPGTGIFITLAGTLTANDTYSFKAIGPTFSNADLVTAINLLKTTYLQAVYSMGHVVGQITEAASDTGAGWITQSSSLDTNAVALAGLGIFMGYFNEVPTVGTVTRGSSGGTYTINTGATDAALEVSRLSVSTRNVWACAGDGEITSPSSGLTFRRNGAWTASARALSVIGSQDIGAVADGGLHGVTSIYRDETQTPGLDAVGFITLRSFPGNVATGGGLPGFFITGGHTMDLVTSDFAPLTNTRVINRGCTIARAEGLPLINSKIPTTTRNGQVGVITELRAQQIDSMFSNALVTAMVSTVPADAVAASAVVNRTHDILADGNLIVAIAIQPFGYARLITINIGLAVAA